MESEKLLFTANPVTVGALLSSSRLVPEQQVSIAYISQIIELVNGR